MKMGDSYPGMGIKEETNSGVDPHEAACSEQMTILSEKLKKREDLTPKTSIDLKRRFSIFPQVYPQVKLRSRILSCIAFGLLKQKVAWQCRHIISYVLFNTLVDKRDCLMLAIRKGL
jgi:hypothetical protein